MKGIGSKTYIIGIFLTLCGGSGLAEIHTSNNGCFWLCAVMFAIGFAICFTEFFKK